MSKDAFFFPHDSNARHDPKILKMRSHYKLEGFGLYWAIIEMMREQEDYLLPIDEDSINGYSLDLNCQPDLLKQFISDCVSNFNLFQSNKDYIWSDSLKRRMANFDEKSAQAKEAANKRWAKRTHSDSNTNAIPTQSERINDENFGEKINDLDTNNADAMPTQSERNAIKSNNIISDNSILNKNNNNGLPDFVDKELWKDFMDMRTKKKVPNTDRAKMLLVNRLTEFNKLGQNPNKVIEESIMNGWTGVFPLKEQSKYQSKHGDGWR